MLHPHVWDDIWMLINIVAWVIIETPGAAKTSGGATPSFCSHGPKECAGRKTISVVQKSFRYWLMASILLMASVDNMEKDLYIDRPEILLSVTNLLLISFKNWTYSSSHFSVWVIFKVLTHCSIIWILLPFYFKFLKLALGHYGESIVEMVIPRKEFCSMFVES